MQRATRKGNRGSRDRRRLPRWMTGCCRISAVVAASLSKWRSVLGSACRRTELIRGRSRGRFIRPKRARNSRGTYAPNSRHAQRWIARPWRCRCRSRRAHHGRLQHSAQTAERPGVVRVSGALVLRLRLHSANRRVDTETHSGDLSASTARMRHAGGSSLTQRASRGPQSRVAQAAQPEPYARGIRVHQAFHLRAVGRLHAQQHETGSVRLAQHFGAFREIGFLLDRAG